MKKTSDRKVLSRLFITPGLTKSELSELLHIRKNTIGSVCSRLLQEEKIIALNPENKRNTRLALNPSAFFAIGMEHAVDRLKLVAVDGGVNISMEKCVKLSAEEGKDRTELIINSIKDYLKELQITPEKLIGFGFSDFIPHDIGEGLKARSIWMPNWGRINIKSILEKNFPAKTSVMRWTDAYAFAEHKWGSGKGNEPFILIQLGEGIGLSVFKNGDCMKGSTDIFGELGHTVYDKDGEICKCGNRGCLETFAGTKAIVENVTKNVVSNTGFVQKTPSGNITFEDIISNIEHGNKLCTLLISDAAEAIGDSVANIINILGIKKVILYGDLTKAGHILVDKANASLRQHCIYPLNIDNEVSVSKLGNFHTAAGAGYKVLEKHFS